MSYISTCSRAVASLRPSKVRSEWLRTSRALLCVKGLSSHHGQVPKLRDRLAVITSKTHMETALRADIRLTNLLADVWTCIQWDEESTSQILKLLYHLMPIPVLDGYIVQDTYIHRHLSRIGTYLMHASKQSLAQHVTSSTPRTLHAACWLGTSLSNAWLIDCCLAW